MLEQQQSSTIGQSDLLTGTIFVPTSKFSVIGSGFIFPTHLEAIQSVGKVVGYDTGEDCVSILTPNDTHFKYCLEEAEKGKIVLCEKPLALNSEDVKKLFGKDIFTVLQLKYHPLVKEIEVKDWNEIEMNILVYRDDKYFSGWKGDEKRSGGILFNLGIHYFHLLLHLFGDATETKLDFLDDRNAKGEIIGAKYKCKFTLKLDQDRNNQRREFIINGKSFNFSKQDNLAYENLHKFVYQDLIKGVGIRPEEAIKSIQLIEKLKWK
jgi:UDP-N-acetyl-2-amino-2-deoxyglucuronate dehydrogenase